MTGWQWHQLDHVQIIAPRSRYQLTTPVPHHSDFYRPDALPAAQPTASEQLEHYRASYAIAVLGVLILSVRLSVTRVLCD